MRRMITKVGDVVRTENNDIGYVIDNPEFMKYVVKTKHGTVSVRGTDISIRSKDKLIEVIKELIDEEPQN